MTIEKTSPTNKQLSGDQAFMSLKSRYIMIGGFLGAGKSTLIFKLAEYLSAKGLQVGLVTNDQGEMLVDTAFLKTSGFPVEEISGGCFCCRFNSLVDASQKLAREARPDVFIAEPVGSCTDLMATVSYPLQRLYGDNYIIAPLTVAVDPVRALRIFKIKSGKSFSDKVIYIYRKQLEEANVIVINKSDLVSAEQLLLLKQTLAGEYADADIYICSARTGDGLLPFFEHITASRLKKSSTMDVDYHVYGQGEALLGWLNATLILQADEPWNGNEALLRCADRIKQRLHQQGAEIAHLKMVLYPDENLYGDLAVVNLVRNDHTPELSRSLPEELQHGRLIVNLRAEAEPDTLGDAVRDVVSDGRHNPAITVEHLEYFKPSQPEPVFRDTAI